LNIKRHDIAQVEITTILSANFDMGVGKQLAITRGEEGCKPWAWDECEEGWVLTSARFN